MQLRSLVRRVWQDRLWQDKTVKVWRRLLVCASGAAEQLMVGVVVGFSPDPNGLMNTSRLASTSRIAHVVVDPTVIYEIQEDAVTSNLAAADISLKVPFSLTAGSATRAAGYANHQ